MPTRALMIIGLTLGLLAAAAASSAQVDTPPESEEESFGPTPPRLGFADGQVSFWRPGADDWVQAQINTALAPGDQLYTGSPGHLEIQTGPRAFVRGWENTHLGLENQEPDFIQFRLTTGVAAFDLRTLEPGHTVEVNTPNAAFTIEHAGYYRVEVDDDRTSFVVRRAGQAMVMPAHGEPLGIAPNEEVVVDGAQNPHVSSYAAPPLDTWDKWNYARTDRLLDAMSARYVSPGTYGLSDLDAHGRWRVVPTYGAVWVPTRVSPGWAPYSTGTWTFDPHYGWTWVDTAPWGWAPYHYGRWVFVDGFWAWAPGPVGVRPVYAPACVAFFGGHGGHVSISTGGPVVGWVALGWGEPVIPWWGRPGFIHRPWWGGWRGPRVVNNVVVHHTTVVHVHEINAYRNTSVRNGVVVVDENRFGRGPIHSAHHRHVDAGSLRPIHAAPKVSATPISYVPTERRGRRPPEHSLKRSVVATRPIYGHTARPAETDRRSEAEVGGTQIVPALRKRDSSALPRAPYGPTGRERIMNGTSERPSGSKTDASRRSGHRLSDPLRPAREVQQTPRYPNAEQPDAPKHEAVRPPEACSLKREDRAMEQPMQPRMPRRATAPKVEDKPQPTEGSHSPATGMQRPSHPRVPKRAAPEDSKRSPDAAPDGSLKREQRGMQQPTQSRVPGRAAPARTGDNPPADDQRVKLRQIPSQPQNGTATAVRPIQRRQTEAARAQDRALPGEPASRLSPNRTQPAPSKRLDQRETRPPAPRSERGRSVPGTGD